MKDFTRWNRTGLPRFRYIEGNAASYLEHLRKSLTSRLQAANIDLDWSFLDPPSAWEDEFTEEQLQQQDQYLAAAIASRRNQYLLEQYNQKRGDLSWEIMRSFARACHVLTEHIDAHTNEAFLRTATQWNSLRKLVETIGYQPAGPSSATTYLVLRAKPGQSGLVKKGLAVRYTPADGSEPIIFETLEDIEIHSELDDIRLHDSERSAKTLIEQATSADPAAKRVCFPRPSRISLTSGSPALLSHLDKAHAVRIEDRQADKYCVPIPQAAEEWMLADTQLQLGPRWSRKAWLNGPDVVRTQKAHGFSKGDIVTWNSERGWIFAVVEECDNRGLRFLPEDGQVWVAHNSVREGLNLPSPGEPLFTASSIKAGNMPAIFESISIDKSQLEDPQFTAMSANKLRSAFSEDALKEYINLLENEQGGGLPFITIPQLIQIAIAIMSKELKIPSTGESPLVVMMRDILGSLLDSGLDESTSPETGQAPEKTKREHLGNYSDSELLSLSNGDAPDLQFSFRFKKAKQDLLFLRKDPQLKAYVVDPMPPEPRFVFDGRLPTIQLNAWVIGEFAAEQVTEIKALKVRELGSNQNDNYFWLEFDDSQARLSSDLVLNCVYADFRSSLKPLNWDNNSLSLPPQLPLDESQSQLISEGRRVLLSGATDPQFSVIGSINGQITLNPPASADFTRSNLRIQGNVVLAGHGESRPERHLSSGEQPPDNASFELAVSNIASRKDSAFPRGTRPDVELTIDQRRWTPVPRLDQSEPTDPHYTIRLTEAGTLMFGFGDGRRGRRLPAGRNNIQLRYRVGAGSAGNLPADSLIELDQAHSLVDSVAQPLAAEGGVDIENVEQMRERAPASLMAMDRAVSSSDFEHLATQRGDVWHAAASYTVAGAGHRDLVELMLIPAGGSLLASNQYLHDEIEHYLRERTLPNVSIRLSDCPRQAVALNLEIRVNSGQYLVNTVLNATRAKLLETFSLEKRGIGRALYHAELYRVIEGIEGVKDSIIYSDGNVREAQQIEPITPHHALYLDPDKLSIDVEARSS